MRVRSSKNVPANVCVCRCVCGCSVCMRASYSLLSKSPWLKDLRLNFSSFTITEARNFLPVRFQHHLSTLVSSTCLNSPLRHSKIRLDMQTGPWYDQDLLFGGKLWWNEVAPYATCVQPILICLSFRSNNKKKQHHSFVTKQKQNPTFSQACFFFSPPFS